MDNIIKFPKKELMNHKNKRENASFQQAKILAFPPLDEPEPEDLEEFLENMIDAHAIPSWDEILEERIKLRKKIKEKEEENSDKPL